MLPLSCRVFSPLRPIKAAARARAFHSATADFVNYGPNGNLVASKVSIRIGDPGEAYVMIPPEVGRALQAGGSSALDDSFSSTPSTDIYSSATFPLSFFHDALYFAQGTSPSNYPRLVVPQQLPRLNERSNVSTATLYLYGLLHTIALNGTFDAEFAELATTQGRQLGSALEMLKDM